MRGCSRGQLRSGPPSTDDSAAQPSTENEQAASETGPETATNHEPGQSLSNELPPELDGKSDHVTRVENPCRSRVWLMKLPEWDPFTGGALDREKVRETLKRYHDEMREGNFSGASSSAALQDGPEALRLWMAEIEADCRWIAGARAAHQAAVPAKSRKRQDGGNEEPAPAAAGASNDSGAEPAAGPQPAAPGTGPQPALAGAPPAGPPALPAAAPPPAAPAPEYDGAMVPVAALAPIALAIAVSRQQNPRSGRSILALNLQNSSSGAFSPLEPFKNSSSGAFGPLEPLKNSSSGAFRRPLEPLQNRVPQFWSWGLGAGGWGLGEAWLVLRCWPVVSHARPLKGSADLVVVVE